MPSDLPNWLHVYESKSGLETLMELYNDQGTGNPCLPATLVLPWERHLTHLNLLPYLPNQDKDMHLQQSLED